MTVYNKVRLTLATLEGVLADFKVAYLETTDAPTKEMYSGFIIETEDVLCKFRNRVEEIEAQESQYKKES